MTGSANSSPEPDYVELHGLGYRAQIMGEDDKARRFYEAALRLKPDYVFSQLALGQIRMLQSGLREGRELYEARFAARGDEAEMAWKQMLAPRWRGEDLRGKSIYLWAEQGLGDVIMFAGLLPQLLKTSPQKITLGVPARLVGLLARSFAQIAVEPLATAAEQSLSPLILEAFPLLLAQLNGQELPPEMEAMRRDYELAQKQEKFDYASPMGDLLVELMPQFAPVNNAAGAYLKADPQRVKAMQQNLAQLGPGRKIGISWHTTNIRDGMVRNISLAQWAPVLAVPNCHFISLQHDVPRAEIAAGIYVEPGFDPVADIEGLAALIAAVDEVITIDNANAHMAGALGVPTKLLLPKGCNFRWARLENPAANLWYPNVKLVRQEVFGRWDAELAQVADYLRGAK